MVAAFAPTLTPKTVKREVTWADLLALDAQERRFEVSEGGLILMPPVGIEPSTITSNVYDNLKPFAREHKLGYVHPDNLLYVLEEFEDEVPVSRFFEQDHFEDEPSE